jgi:dihydrodipicolinate synthase/N-acetylneuraminate lyase
MKQIVAATNGSGLRLLQGSERLILPSLEAGADGCVSALAGIAPEWHRQLIDAFRSDQFDVAEERQQRLMQLLELFQLGDVSASLAHFVHTLKYAAVCRDWLTNPASLLPGFDPTPEFECAIRETLDRSGLLNEPEPITTETD